MRNPEITSPDYGQRPRNEALKKKKLSGSSGGFGGSYDASRNKKDLKRSRSHRIKHF